MSNPESEKLFRLIRQGHAELVRRTLVDADIVLTSIEGQNLLHEAVACKSFEISAFLINKGISVNHQDKNGQTPLHFAATLNQLDIARLIVQHGGDATVVDEHGNTPLWSAVFNARGKYDVVELLLRAGGVPTIKNKHGRSPLDFARKIEDQKLVAILEKSDLSGDLK